MSIAGEYWEKKYDNLVNTIITRRNFHKDKALEMFMNGYVNQRHKIIWDAMEDLLDVVYERKPNE